MRSLVAFGTVALTLMLAGTALAGTPSRAPTEHVYIKVTGFG